MSTNRKKSVLITGASSGIGYASVQRMIHSGWHVFAAVRKQSDADKLRADCGGDVIPLTMDVKDRPTIAAAAERVADQLQGRGLDALVNVAGIGMVRPIEYASAADLQDIFEINVFGQIAVTQAFLPLLRRARGRIVNITSVGAHIPIPFGGLLNASKSAFGMLSEVLRLELRAFGLRVSIIEPGAIVTPAVDKTLGDIRGVIASLPADGEEQYGEMLRRFGERAYARAKDGSSPNVVAQAVHHALTASRPKIRYRVGKHANLLATLPKVLPDRILDELLLRMSGVSTASTAAKSARQSRQPKLAMAK
jgi:NAD(P)-dependent dehydrogenase (short-subunit alcohol dehydrogenase family)